VAVADLADPARGPALDVGCGGGHLTRFLVHRHGPDAVLGIDQNFFLLYLAATRIAPGARFVCADIEQGFPLAGGRFGLVLMSNVLHFLTDKRACLASARRVLAAEGLFVASSVRNRLVPAPTPSQALSPEAYQELLDELPSVIVSDDSLLRGYLAHRGPALAHSDPGNVLVRSRLLTIVSGGDDSVFRQHEAPVEWPHAIGRLAVNPLYRRTASPDGGMRLELAWPSPGYEEDNSAMKSYLPRHAELSPAVMEALSNGQRTQDMRPLLSSLVLLDVPPGY
jgi:SAM-dependent methyltransferase